MSADPQPAGRGLSVLSALPDAELAARAGGGDSGAFEALYRRHRDGLLRYCTRILRHSHDAEEALQATMFSAHRALAGGRRPAAVRAWLAAIARNECRDVLRTRQSVEPLAADVPGRSEAPEEGVVRRQRLRALHDDLGALPGRQRAALMLNGVAGLPHAEVAHLIGASPGETRSLLHEARESLSEFEAGRDLRCADVRERVESGDGRALRARRIGAHLRVCAACREHVERTRVRGRRRGLGVLLPPPLVEVLRALLGAGRAAFGGSPAGVAGTAGAGIAAIASTLVLVGGAPTGGGPEAGSGESGPATLQATASPFSAGATAPAGQPTRRTPAGQGASAPAGGAGAAPAPGAAPAAPPQAQVAPGATPASATSGPPAAAPAAAPGGSSAASTGVTVAPLTVPSVTVPSVSVLPVKVPSVTVPSVSVQLPKVPLLPQLPAVQTPAITTPTVELPPLPLPLPEVRLPEIRLPEIPLPGIQVGAQEDPP